MDPIDANITHSEEPVDVEVQVMQSSAVIEQDALSSLSRLAAASSSAPFPPPFMTSHEWSVVERPESCRERGTLKRRVLGEAMVTAQPA